MKKLTLLLVVAFLISVFVSSCRKHDPRACISEGVWFNDTIATFDTVSFLYCYLELFPDDYDYEWNFGDGYTASGMSVKHFYSAPGTYTVVQRVSRRDEVAIDSVTMTVLNVDAYTYEGTYKANRIAVGDSTVYPEYTVNITDSDLSHIVINNIHDQGMNVNATVNNFNLTIPVQQVSGDTISGVWGKLSVDLNTIDVLMGHTAGSTSAVWSLKLKRQ